MSRPGTRGREHFWSARKVSWYRRANERSDYASTVLAVTSDLLASCASALDVGAGFGALAIPLARRLAWVTALEPSAAMADVLAGDAAREKLSHLVVIEAAWGTVPIEPHDLVVCAHVGPLLGRGSRFLAELGCYARRGVVLVRDVPGDDDKFFFKELYPLFLGMPYDRCCDYAETLEELEDLGVTPTVTPIEYASDQPFDSLDEACDFWMEYMGLAGADVRERLQQFLAARLERRGREWIAPFRKRAAVLHWRVREENNR